MLRRVTAIVALVIACLLAVLAGPVLSQEPIVLKGQSAFPPTSRLHLSFQLWAETVEKMSGGRLKIEALPAGAIVPPFEVFDATSRGVLDVGWAPLGFILGKSPATIPLSHGPLFGMDGLDFYAWYYDGGGMELLDEFYRDVVKLDVVGFPIPLGYPQGLGWFKKPIKNLEELKGIKYRIYGIGADVFGQLGVSVVTLPPGEIVPAMERGLIDGAEWINCSEDKKLGLPDVAKYFYTPGMHEPVTSGQLTINREVWEKLTPDLKEMVKVASVYATTLSHFAFNRETAQACEELVAAGVEIIHTPDDILTSFLSRWDGIQAEYAAKDPFYRKVIESQKAYAQIVVPFRLSFWPPYDFAGNFYWKDKVYQKSVEPAKAN